MKRQIIKIDEEKCNGCGLCVPNCPEGAIQMLDGKARLVSDLFCDGLGACIGECPQGAITVEEREAEPYDERKVMTENIIPKGMTTINAHLKHLRDHGETKLLHEALDVLKEQNISIADETEAKGNGHAGCPGMMAKMFSKKAPNNDVAGKVESELRQWPIQLKLVSPEASYFDNADLLIAADCTAFAHGDFHREFIKDKIVLIFCPKLDPYIELYIDKLAEIFSKKSIKSITIARMEVPCCGGTEVIVQKALEKVGKSIEVKSHIINIA